MNQRINIYVALLSTLVTAPRLVSTYS